MKYISLAILTFSLLACTSNSTSVDESADSFSIENVEATMEELNKIIDDLWSNGYPNRDTALVSSLYHPKFNLVDDEGSVFTKEDELSYVLDYGDQYANFSYEITNVCVYENGTAVANADCKFLGTSVDGAFSTEYLQSLTFSKINGEWKIIYSQVSGVTEKAIPNAPE